MTELVRSSETAVISADFCPPPPGPSPKRVAEEAAALVLVVFGLEHVLQQQRDRERVGVPELEDLEVGGGDRVLVELLDQLLDHLQRWGRGGDDHAVGPLVERGGHFHLQRVVSAAAAAEVPVVAVVAAAVLLALEHGGDQLGGGLGVGVLEAVGLDLGVAGDGVGVELLDDAVDHLKRLGRRGDDQRVRALVGGGVDLPAAERLVDRAAGDHALAPAAAGRDRHALLLHHLHLLRRHPPASAALEDRRDQRGGGLGVGELQLHDADVRRRRLGLVQRLDDLRQAADVGGRVGDDHRVAGRRRGDVRVGTQHGLEVGAELDRVDVGGAGSPA
jgi:hypothetical protein